MRDLRNGNIVKNVSGFSEDFGTTPLQVQRAYSPYGYTANNLAEVLWINTAVFSEKTPFD